MNLARPLFDVARRLPGELHRSLQAPAAYRFVDSLPKNNYGKVLKTELRRC